jgi:Flp pilus assembly protein TadD
LSGQAGQAAHGDERDRRLSVPPDSTREVEHEDFLFHLYRGSELLQENRVHEAKEELEFALTMQPLDSKGQDLLGAVYFRLGLYPRAIQIYESLEVQFPRDVSIKINLALCYLKTGQPEPARRALLEAVQINPEHKRAWGYLGLALQKLGDVEQAQVALERGGHANMAQRLVRNQQDTLEAVVAAGVDVDGEVRSVAETAFSELDAGELRFALAQPEPSGPPEAPWHTREIGAPTTKPKSPHRTTLPPPSIRQPPTVHEAATIAPVDGVVVPELAPPLPAAARAIPPGLLALPDDQTIGLHPSGPVIVRIAGERAFIGRLEALRVVAGAVSTRVLHRRTREGGALEVLGGIGSPLVQMTGTAQLVLGPRATQSLALVPLDDELAFVREDVLLGFDSTLTYENGRLALDATTEGTPIVQLRGTGSFVADLARSLVRVPCVAGSPLLVRREWIVGWTGRLLPRALAPGESLSGQRGLIGFTGEGSVLVVCAG